MKNVLQSCDSYSAVLNIRESEDTQWVRRAGKVYEGSVTHCYGLDENGPQDSMHSQVGLLQGD